MNRRGFMKRVGAIILAAFCAPQMVVAKQPKETPGTTHVPALYMHACGEVVAERSIGPIHSGDLLSSREWKVLGEQMTANSPIVHICPKCGERFGMSSCHLILVQSEKLDTGDVHVGSSA